MHEWIPYRPLRSDHRSVLGTFTRIGRHALLSSWNESGDECSHP